MLKSKLSIHLYPYLRTLLKYVSLSLFEFFLIIQIGFIIRQLFFFIHIVFLQLTRDDTDNLNHSLHLSTKVKMYGEWKVTSFIYKFFLLSFTVFYKLYTGTIIRTQTKGLPLFKEHKHHQKTEIPVLIPWTEPGNFRSSA